MTDGSPTERDINQFYAEQHGYFWKACDFPGCGRMFGGHECGTYNIQDPDDPKLSTMTCKLHDEFARLMLSQHLVLNDYWSSDNRYHYSGYPESDIKYCRDRDIPLPEFERDVQI